MTQQTIMKMITKPLTEENIEEAAILFMTVFNGEPWNEKWQIEGARRRITDFYSMPGYIGMAAFSDKMEGFVLGNREAWYNGDTLFLYEFCVVSNSQGKGTGTLIFNSLLDTIKENPVKSIYLLTKRDTNAEHFYRKLGFNAATNMVMMGMNTNLIPDKE